jgi:TetR/AcrR family transcriptional regulator, transcriptional repressor for nem operon
MASPQHVGAEPSNKRELMLRAVERLMIDEGYAGVTYRAVAAIVGVTGGAVQYYFPTLDDLFVAVIQWRGEQNIQRLAEALVRRSDQPLRVLWEYSRDESTSALTSEFLALGNHRKSIRSEIAQTTERVRRLQLDLVSSRVKDMDVGIGGLSPDALLYLITGIPKLIRLEQGVGVSTSHAETVEAFEKYLDSVEPSEPTNRQPSSAGRKKRPS